ncbi:MAG: class II aldolase/adducin family protein [Gemmatimonadaceae bacterium]
MVCRRLYDRGLIAGSDGNVSARLGDDRILVTPAGMSKVDVREDDVVEVELGSGTVKRAERAQRPSTELAMHLGVYRRRSDAHAIVHAHPPYATAFAAAHVTLAADVLPEMVFQLGTIASLPFVIPGTEDVAHALQPYLEMHDVFLLANHGATALGPSLTVAHQRMESLEHGARIIWLARALGGARPLPADAAAALLAARARAVVESTSPNDSRSGR